MAETVSVPEKIPNYLLRVEDIFNETKPTSGEIGVEIEVEGQNLVQEFSSYWTVHADNSLRGESAEYVMTKPVARQHVHNILEYLEKKLIKFGSRVFDSSRTSVHVHVNCQGMSIKQVYTFIVLYLIFEDLLVEFAGPSRVGNVFCLRAKDAEAFVDMLANCLTEDNYKRFTQQNQYRYSSINVCALHKFNSLEFRAFRGTVKAAEISEWVSLLLNLKDASMAYDNPADIILELSTLGAQGFVRKIFPAPVCDKFLSRANLYMTLMEAARLAQEIAFAVRWKRGQGTGTKKFFRSTEGSKKDAFVNAVLQADDIEEGGLRIAQGGRIQWNPGAAIRGIRPVPAGDEARDWAARAGVVIRDELPVPVPVPEPEPPPLPPEINWDPPFRAWQPDPVPEWHQPPGAPREANIRVAQVVEADIEGAARAGREQGDARRRPGEGLMAWAERVDRQRREALAQRAHPIGQPVRRRERE